MYFLVEFTLSQHFQSECVLFMYSFIGYVLTQLVPQI